MAKVRPQRDRRRQGRASRSSRSPGCSATARHLRAHRRERVAQLETNVAALDRRSFTADELAEIDRHATDSDINIWAASSSE